MIIETCVLGISIVVAAGLIASKIEALALAIGTLCDMMADEALVEVEHKP